MFALVLVSKYFYPSIYFEFLKEAVTYISDKSSLEKCIDELWRMLEDWKLTACEKSVLKFPFEEKIKKLNDDSHVFDDYDPYTTFPNHQKFNALWKSLFLCAPIKVVADDEEELTKAVFSLLSLISPYKYAGQVLFLLNSHDPRLAKASQYPVVGVLKSISNYATGSFSSIIAQAPVIEGEYEGQREEQRSKMRRLQTVHLYLMDRILLINPYNDLLNGPYINDSLENEMRSKDNNGLFTAQELRVFERSPTAVEYRKKNIYRDAFRNAFLSVPAEDVLSGKSVSHLQTLITILDTLKKDFKGDAHMISVIKAHRRVIHQLLSDFRSGATQ